MSPFANLRAARPALATFAAMGVLWGTFAADLPDIKTMLGVDESRLGLLLFMTPIAAMAAMLLAPALARIAGRVALPVATLLMAAAFALPGQAALWWLFPFAMLACGAGTGISEILMNARVSAMEEACGTPLMNLSHAVYSFGYAFGATLTGVLRSAGQPPSVVMATMAGLAAAIALAAFERDGHILGLDRPKEGWSGRLGLVPVIGGGIVLIAFLTENAAESWSALHIEQSLNGSPAFGAAAPAIMALTMGFSRLVGQGLSGRIDPIRLLLAGALVSAVGAFVVAAALSPVMAYAGFIVMGAGSSVISPTALTLVGALADPVSRARAVARATMLGYFGYFVGPPLVGFIAGGFGLRAAFVFAALMLGFIWVLAPVMARQR